MYLAPPLTVISSVLKRFVEFSLSLNLFGADCHVPLDIQCVVMYLTLPLVILSRVLK